MFWARGIGDCVYCSFLEATVFRRRNPGTVPPQALGLDKQPVSQTHTLTPNPYLNPNLNPNLIREMCLTNVSLILLIVIRLSGVGSGGQQLKQGAPDFPFPSHIDQL